MDRLLWIAPCETSSSNTARESSDGTTSIGAVDLAWPAKTEDTVDIRIDSPTMKLLTVGTAGKARSGHCCGKFGRIALACVVEVLTTRDGGRCRCHAENIRREPRHVTRTLAHLAPCTPGRWTIRPALPTVAIRKRAFRSSSVSVARSHATSVLLAVGDPFADVGSTQHHLTLLGRLRDRLGGW